MTYNAEKNLEKVFEEMANPRWGLMIDHIAKHHGIEACMVREIRDKYYITIPEVREQLKHRDAKSLVTAGIFYEGLDRKLMGFDLEAPR